MLQAIQWCGDHLRLLDQRHLPQQTRFVDCYSVQQVADAIQNMMVRGAPAIGICAAYGIVLATMATPADTLNQPSLDAAFQLLAATRPTAVNLTWALARMQQCFQDGTVSFEDVLQMARHLHQQDLQMNQQMAVLGASLIEANSVVYTHCNTGSLATAGVGTALGVIAQAAAQGHIQQVLVGETRPWLQGARLTLWELQQLHIPAALVVDSAAAHFMAQQRPQWLIVGADRICANGDVANKIGTYGLAVLAQHHGVKVMVVAPSSSCDASLTQGADIVIEQRDPREICEVHGVPIAPAHSVALNPAFDVTPAAYIDVLVTEKGLIQQPDSMKLKALLWPD